MITKEEAIQSLKPGAEWVLRGDDLEWLDKNQTEPTSAEIDAEVTRLETLKPLSDLRRVRNGKLTETDWVVTMHKELGTNIPTAWKTYRQALRDITETYTSLDDVVWPEKP